MEGGTDRKRKDVGPGVSYTRGGEFKKLKRTVLVIRSEPDKKKEAEFLEKRRVDQLGPAKRVYAPRKVAPVGERVSEKRGTLKRPSKENKQLPHKTRYHAGEWEGGHVLGKARVC